MFPPPKNGPIFRAVVDKGKSLLIMFKMCSYNKRKRKDKAVPLQAWSGPEGSR